MWKIPPQTGFSLNSSDTRSCLVLCCSEMFPSQPKTCFKNHKRATESWTSPVWSGILIYLRAFYTTAVGFLLFWEVLPHSLVGRCHTRTFELAKPSTLLYKLYIKTNVFLCSFTAVGLRLFSQIHPEWLSLTSVPHEPEFGFVEGS